ncbi:MAG: PD-(D/E)XK nuclease-like domain-containing protein [Eubacteriales bacterium]|nr:PD-(D/E)XK nuclease-like domain-containing protein [Eubacteriales bacterium]
MITSENYFSQENQMKYFGSSQFKAFASCEAAALAEIKAEYIPEETTALLVGSYVDAHFEGTLDIFQAQHPSIFTRQGDLKAEYRRAEQIIQRLERDKLFMKYMAGKKQVIMTGELFGYPWKIKIDSYLEKEAIVDLKVMKDFRPIWVDGQGKIPFVEAWGYDLQAAVYQTIEGNKLPFIVAGATKEPVTDLDLFEIPQYKMDIALKLIEARIDRFADIKAGIETPRRCEECDYCKMTKVLTRIKPYDDGEAVA